LLYRLKSSHCCGVVLLRRIKSSFTTEEFVTEAAVQS